MPKNTHFQFKQFRIEQAGAAMKVGVDGVLLGAWVNKGGARKILDVGTGTGLIALMLAQRFPNAQITALELDEVAYQEAVGNVARSGWSDRILVRHTPFQQFVAETKEAFDLVVSNPPFYTGGSKALDESRAIARHTDSLSLHDLICYSAGLLNVEGSLAMIYPVEYLPEIEKLAAGNGLWIKRACSVKPNPRKPAHRIMVELTNIRTVRKDEELMIEFDRHHEYTPEYKALTRDFYLKF